MISPNQDGLQTIIYNKCEFSEGIWILKRWPAVRMNGMVMSCHVTSRHVLPSWWFHIFCGFQFSIANRWMTTLFIGHRSWTHQPIPIRGWDLCPLCQFAYAAYAWNGSLGGWVTVANNIKGPGAPGRSHSLNSWSPVCKPSWTSLGGLGSSDDPWWLVMVVVVVVVVVVAVLGWVGPRSTRNRPSLDDGGNCPIPRPWLSQTAPAIRSPAATWRISTTWSTFGGSGVARCRRCQCHVGPRRWKVREPQIDSPRLSVEGGGQNMANQSWQIGGWSGWATLIYFLPFGLWTDSDASGLYGCGVLSTCGEGPPGVGTRGLALWNREERWPFDLQRRGFGREHHCQLEKLEKETLKQRPSRYMRGQFLAFDHFMTVRSVCKMIQGWW